MSLSPPSIESVMLTEARADVLAADHKASLVLASLGIGFGALLGGLLAREWEPADMDGAGEALWWLGAIAAAISILSAGSAVWPRYKTDDVSEGVYYWGHVATFDSVESLRAAMLAKPPDSHQRTLHQLWRLGRIVRKKYRLVRAAMISSASALILFAVASLVGG